MGEEVEEYGKEKRSGGEREGQGEQEPKCIINY